jgi:hypothetical protein
MKNLEWAELWDAMDAQPGAWIPTTEDMFWAMLEALPPRAQRRRAFLVGEALRSNDEGQIVYSCFKNIGDEYFARNLTLEQFNREF